MTNATEEAYDAGVADAMTADGRREALGLLAGPILFDVAPGTDPAVAAAYLRGAAMVVGAANVVTRAPAGEEDH